MAGKKKRKSRKKSKKKKRKSNSRKIRVCVKATTYKRNGKTIHRKAYCYERKDVGKPGKGPKLIEVEPGKLKKYGYSTKKSETARHRALAKAVKAYGALSVFRMLNAQVIFRKRQPDHAKSVFIKDRDWIKQKYLGD